MNEEAENNNMQEPKQQSRRINFGVEGALIIAIITASILVAISYFLYLNNENYKYDIARPGAQKLKTVDSEETEINDTTSPVDAKAVKEKIELLNAEQEVLNSLGSFDQKPVTDAAMQLEL